ncbi:MAG: DUF692 family multinuclear iron-containing protein [Cellvibrio sp.]|uniref:DUF692 domain-containing protein n=1 Tax=Cellvibrio sp. TaxID=1965322 RepID=UPI0031A53A86
MLQPLRKLGVGINYHWDFQDLIRNNLSTIDYIEISPDIFCEEVFTGNTRHFRMDNSKLQDALAIGNLCPVIVHGLGLSIGSASGWNSDYLSMLDQYAQQQSFSWHSEHLGFTLVKNQDGSEDHAGLLLPMPFTQDALDLLCPRIQQLCNRYAVPFLLENTTYYLPALTDTYKDGREWDEIDFLNKLVARTDCGLLLDLYNFYCNAINFGFDPYHALARLQLDRVIEIHVAGGIIHEGFLLDVHSSEVPDAVWELLEWILPQAPNLCAITYEVLEQALPLMGEANIVAQLQRCKTLWNQYLTIHCNPFTDKMEFNKQEDKDNVAA